MSTSEQRGTTARPGTAPSEIPAGEPATAQEWASDVVADTLRALSLRYVALTPGATFRGLHDSIVNHQGNHHPQLVLCLHEEHAVAVAHGYAKAAGRPMAVALHSNVGLMHASMALYNAYCDQAPLLVLGAGGPADTHHRRAWTDWVHTFTDQAALVRPFLKWDDQPGSLPAAVRSLLRGAQLAAGAPRGPVYVSLDSELLEEPHDGSDLLADAHRFPPLPAPVPADAELDRAARLLAGAEHPVILVGRTSTSGEAWDQRVALAELLGAEVVTDLKQTASFPTRHPLHHRDTGIRLTARGRAAVAAADVVLSLDWLDLGTALRDAGQEHTTVVHATLAHQNVRGYTQLDFWPGPVDVTLTGHPDDVVGPLLERLRTLRTPATPPYPTHPEPRPEPETERPDAAAPLTLDALARTVHEACAAQPATLIRATLNWPEDAWPLTGPMDYLGMDGGGGLGSGPGMAVGGALALLGSGRLPVAVLGDGDYSMGVTALWTAAHYRLPLLLVVANNMAYLNDVTHQSRVAATRARPDANRGIATTLVDPPLDVLGLATAQGARGFGPVESVGTLRTALGEAIAEVRAGGVAVVDARMPRP
ncbi:thiamine pyrophosphate-binding protein [Streptomyces sp. NPDC050560]|uniref:thiamine pyrophosphate-binding protein n=1 Tax=Streptomyces sp. NPDC050560 TaxID=3365630 RepID=UPI0037991016